MSLLRDLARLTRKKLRVRIGGGGGGATGGGLSTQDNADLGIAEPGAGEPDGAVEPYQGTDVATEGLQAQVLGAIQVSPTHVIRSKCPRGYTLIKMPGLLTANVCVLTKVARALGLAHKRHGRGISARDLRATLRVTRLIKHMEKALPHRVSHSQALAKRK